MFELILYQSVIILAIASSLIVLLRFNKSVKDLPGGWRKSVSVRNFQLSVLFLTLYLSIIFIGEVIALSLAKNGIYNNFIIAFNYTLHVPFILGFFFVNTQSVWKKYAYIALYFILIGFYLSEGDYHPNSVATYKAEVIVSCIHFTAAFLHLTDLLVKPKSSYFRFQLKISICILTYSILSNVISSFYAYHIEFNLTYPEIIYQIHFYNIMLFYILLLFVFINEIIKLIRVNRKHSSKPGL